MDEMDLHKVGVLKENGDCTRCALKIDTIDGTSLVGAVCVGKFGNGCEKQKVISELDETIDHENVDKQERGGREKRCRRRGNTQKLLEAQNGCKRSEEETSMTGQEYAVTDAQNSSNRYGEEVKRTYSIAEMEAMRFLNIEAQKKRWLEVYCGLAPSVAKEYDGLVNYNQKKQTQLDFDPRKQFKNVQMNCSVRDEDCFQVLDNVTGNMSPSDPDPDPECSEEDDDDDDCTSILRPAFFVSGEPKFDSGPPQDGLEYLRRVRWEAERIPKVKVVELEKHKLNKEQTVYMPTIPDIAKCPEHLLPVKEWEDMFLADFMELRQAFSSVGSSIASSSSILKLPSPVNKPESNTLFHGNLVDKMNSIIFNEVESGDDPNLSSIVDGSINCKSSVSGSSTERPTLSEILKMDSVARLSMLRRRITGLENMISLSKNDCLWLFALCVAIDTPLDSDTCASLRCLLRKVSSLRARRTQMDDEVIMLNIIATITGKYFGQSG